MRHFELPVFVDDKAHAEKLKRLDAPEHVVADHARVMGARVREIASDLKISPVGHTPTGINDLVVEMLRVRLLGLLAGAPKNLDGEELLNWLNEPRDEGQTPPRITEAFAGIPYHPNAVTNEDVEEAMK